MEQQDSTKIEPSLNKMKTCIKDGFACELWNQADEPPNTKLNDSYKEYACPNGNLKPNLIHGNHVMYLCNSTMTYSAGIDSRKKEKKMHALSMAAWISKHAEMR